MRKIRKNVPLIIILILISMSVFGTAAFAYDSEDADYRSKNDFAEHFGRVDDVDLYTGNLIVKHTDLTIPGNGGLDINVNRIYSLAGLSAGLTAAYALSYRWTTLGPGWSLRVAPRLIARHHFGVGSTVNYLELSLHKLCFGKHLGNSTRQFVLGGKYLPTIELPDGSSIKFFSVGGNTAVSKDNWRLTCNDYELRAYAPDGTIHEFGDLYKDGKVGKEAIHEYAPMGPGKVPPNYSEVYLDTLKTTDANGNWIKYFHQDFGRVKPAFRTPQSFRGAVPVASGRYYNQRASQVIKIESSDGRVVNFLYDQKTYRLKKIKQEQKTVIDYEYVDVLPNRNSQFLNKVIRSDGSYWKYSYIEGDRHWLNLSDDYPVRNQASTWFRLSELTYPSGGSVSYDYEPYAYKHSYKSCKGPLGSSRYKVRGERVKRRTLSTGEAWDYQYQKGGIGEYDVTSENGPNGLIQYQFMGTGYKQGFYCGMGSPATKDGVAAPHNTAWQVGMKQEVHYPDGSRELFKWSKRELFDSRYSMSALGFIVDEKVWAPVLESRTIFRDGARYFTKYMNYDDYGNPGTILEEGPNNGSKTTSVTYHNDTDHWVIGKLKSKIYPGSELIREYDDRGNLVSERKDGAEKKISYDSEGNVSQIVTPLGHIYKYLDHRRGIAQEERHPENIVLKRVVGDAGEVLSETDGEGHTKKYTYDGLNRITSINYPLGADESVVYTNNSQTSTRGEQVVTVNYDGFGRTSEVNVGGVITKYSYDALDRLIFESYPNSQLGTTYEYDTHGRIVRIGNSDGSEQIRKYISGNVEIVDERTNSTLYRYRSYGDPEQKFLMEVQPPLHSATVSFERNTKGQIKSIAQGGFERSYEYDSFGHLSAIESPERGRIEYANDIEGNLIAKTVGGSKRVKHRYDGKNRKIASIYAGNTPDIRYSYNKVGNLLTAKSDGGDRSFSYDGNGNLIEESLSIDERLFSVKYGYNSIDQLIAIQYPISKKTVSFDLDRLGRPSRILGYIDEISYWPNGQPKVIDYANGTLSKYGQNNRLWPSSFETSLSENAHYVDSRYSYDRVGNLLSVVDTANSAYDRTLDYDEMDRLISASGPWGQGYISYDSLGNITSKEYGEWIQEHIYDQKNRLVEVLGTQSSVLEYDDFGNVNRYKNKTFDYDNVPNLKCAKCGANNEVLYRYDGLSKRSSTTKKGVVTYEFFNNEGLKLIDYTPARSNKLVEYIYLADKRIAQRVTTDDQPTGISVEKTTVRYNGSNKSIEVSVNISNKSARGTAFLLLGGVNSGTVLAETSVVSGIAVFDVSDVPDGRHQFTVVYSGDSKRSGNIKSFDLDLVSLDG